MPKRRPNPPVFILELTPIGEAGWAAVPVEARLARLLRAASRSYGLRAIRLTPKPKTRKRRKADA